MRPQRILRLQAFALALAAGWFASAAPAADDITEMSNAYEHAMLLEKQGDFAGALKYHERSLAFAARAFGPQSKQVGMAMHNMAKVYSATYQYSQAETLYHRIIGLTEARLGKNHHEVAYALVHLADLYQDTAQYALAEPLYLRTIQIEAGLDNRIELAKTCINLGTLYFRMGRYAKAERLLLRATEILRNTPNADPLDAAYISNSLGGVYQALGQYAKAEPLYVETLRVREASLGPDDTLVAHSLHNLAWLYSEMQQFDRAEPLFLRALKILETRFGKNHADLQIILNNLANLQRSLGRAEEADRNYQRGLSIAEAAKGKDHPEVAYYLNNLAELHLVQGNYRQAQPLYHRCLEIFNGRLGAEYVLISTVRNNLAVSHVALAEADEAARQFDQSRRLVRRHAARVLPLLSENEQLTFLVNTDREHFANALSFGLEHGNNPTLAGLSAAWLANGKAVAEASLAERTQLARDPTLVPVVQRLQAVRGQLATLTLAADSPGQPTTRQAQLAQLTAEEQELSKQIARTRGEQEGTDPWIGIEAIRQALAAKDVLLDIARFEPKRFSAKLGEPQHEAARYVAWLVPPVGRDTVRVIDLGPASVIDAAIGAYRTEMAAAQSADPAKNVLLDLGEVAAEKQLVERLAALATLVLAPLEPHLVDAEQIILCPDAALWLIPWAALPTSSEPPDYAIERWRLRYVVAGREVVLEKTRSGTQRKAGPPRLFANPAYDLDPATALAEYNAVFTRLGGSPLTPRTAAAEADELALRSATRLGRVAALPGTAAEAAAVAPKLQAYAQAEPRAYLDKQAQEGIFKRLASPQVLVISTHGFFLPDQQQVARASAESKSAKQGVAGIVAVTARPALENPLLRCGLLLAGCNQAEKLAAGGLDDGVLTGMEIVGADLRSTELVVLSACETGLGQINQGEGVTGLRQAFQLSGARAVVSTLWQIPDLESAVLMNEFFTQLAAGQSRPEALRNAQLARIAARRQQHGAAHPFFWAAWTLTGD